MGHVFGGKKEEQVQYNTKTTADIFFNDHGREKIIEPFSSGIKLRPTELVYTTSTKI
jgi:hypothetical protein